MLSKSHFFLNPFSHSALGATGAGHGKTTQSQELSHGSVESRDVGQECLEITQENCHICEPRTAGDDYGPWLSEGRSSVIMRGEGGS